MKSLKYVLIALSLSASVAHAQDLSSPQTAQASSQTVQYSRTANDGQVARHRSVHKANECVGPVSFCNTYFGN
jgi:hypothetical protein